MKARASTIGNNNWKLYILLPLVVILITFVIASFGNVAGVGVISLLIGALICILTIREPLVGFYTSFIVSFIVFDLQRIIARDLPLATFVDLIIFLTFLSVLFKKYAANESFLDGCRNAVVAIQIIIFVYYFVQLLNPAAGSKILTILIIRKFVTYLMILYSALYLLRSVSRINAFFKFWIASVFLAGLYACYQEWVGYPAYEMNYILADPLLTGLYSLDNGNYRKFSFMSDPTAFGILSASVALVCLVFILNLKLVSWRRWLLGIITIIIVLGMSYSGTRTAYFIFAFGMVLYVLMTLSSIRTLVFACVSVIGFVFVIYGPIYGNGTINRIRSTFEFSEDASLQVRDVNRQKVQPYIHSHPLGGGVGTTGPNALIINPGHPLAGFPPDSGLLRTALELGWIGLLIYGLSYFLLMNNAVAGYYNDTDPHRRGLLLATVVALFSYIVADYAQVAIGPIPGAFYVYSLAAVTINLRAKIVNPDTPDI